jgi:hypothetical protein
VGRQYASQYTGVRRSQSKASPWKGSAALTKARQDQEELEARLESQIENRNGLNAQVEQCQLQIDHVRAELDHRFATRRDLMKSAVNAAGCNWPVPIEYMADCVGLDTVTPEFHRVVDDLVDQGQLVRVLNPPDWLLYISWWKLDSFLDQWKTGQLRPNSTGFSSTTHRASP